MFRRSVDEKEVFAGIPESHSACGISPLFGIGIHKEVAKSLGIRLEWEHFFNLGKSEETVEGDLNVLGVNLFYPFPLQ